MDSSPLSISVRFEGGLGDCILSNRFVCAIREKYPEAEISAYFDNEGDSHQANFIKEFFPSNYKSIQVIPYRKDKQYKHVSQFGEEVFPAHLDNLPEDILAAFRSSDLFYDLHIDSLKWLKADYDWRRFYYFFPRPEKVTNNLDLPPKFVLLHLYARASSPYNCEDWYINRLIKQITESYPVVIICQEQTKGIYSDFSDNPLVSFVTGGLSDCVEASSKCSAFIGIDSGIKFLPVSFGKPFLFLSKDCPEYQRPQPSHQIRWLIFKDNILPIITDYKIVADITKNLVEEPASSIFPSINRDTIKRAIVDRNL